MALALFSITVFAQKSTDLANDNSITTHESFGTHAQKEKFTHQWHISSNLLPWTLLIPNIGGEVDLHPHWSASANVAYSALNYFTSTCKFRTFSFRPEIRCWPGIVSDGFYVEGHLQMTAYDIATPGMKYRIQDVGGKHPALGGGIGIGFRKQLGDSRWSMEGHIGAGIYDLKYNRFENKINGKLIDTHHRTYYGIDKVAVSLIYTFRKNVVKNPKDNF